MAEMRVSRYQVRKLWQPYGQEVIDIHFAGQYTPEFTEATDAVVAFFQDLEHE